MEEISETKAEVRVNMEKILAALSDSEIEEKVGRIENRLFEFANFLESNIVLLYSNSKVDTSNIIKRCFAYNKIVILPAFDPETYEAKLMKG